MLRKKFAAEYGALRLRGPLAKQQPLEVAGDDIDFEIDPSADPVLAEQRLCLSHRNDVQIEQCAVDIVYREAHAVDRDRSLVACIDTTSPTPST